MRIGELAKRSGVEATTIRYYEQIGLMPAPARKESGYRDYGKEAAARLSFIRTAQSVGLTLGEIREVLAFRDREEIPCLHVASLIDKKAAELTERISALEQMRKDLARLAKRARAAPPGPKREATFCHIIEGQALKAP